jgi:conserved oligomeric Golgi complex subunit 4
MKQCIVLTSSYQCRQPTAKDRLVSNELHSNVALYRACTPFARLVQIAKLMNLDDLEDVLDLISSSKRKGNWDLKLDDSKSYLSLRVEFDSERVIELLRVAEVEE